MDSDAALFPTTFAITRRPTPKQRLKDAKPIMVFLGLCFLFGLLLPPLSGLFFGALWSVVGHNFGLYMIAMCGAGFLLGIGAVAIVRFTSRQILGANRRTIEALEQRLATGSPNVIADLDALITAHLKAGRAPVAEFYSKQLLQLSEREPGEELVPELVQSTSCWVSTPEYHKSANYWLVWMYQSRGLLCLSREHLEYESSRISFRVELKDIIDISIARHPLWMKPYPLRYITITFREPDFGAISTMYVTPYTMQTDTVIDINNSVQEWYLKLTKALGSVC